MVELPKVQFLVLVLLLGHHLLYIPDDIPKEGGEAAKEVLLW